VPYLVCATLRAQYGKRNSYSTEKGKERNLDIGGKKIKTLILEERD
jgi:hypothetical protein